VKFHLKTMDALLQANFQTLERRCLAYKDSNVRPLNRPRDISSAQDKEASIALSRGRVTTLLPTVHSIDLAFLIAWERYLNTYRDPLSCLFLLSGLAPEDLSMRFLTMLSGLNPSADFIGNIAREDWMRLTSAVGMLVETPIYINSLTSFYFDDVMQCVSSIRQQGWIGLVVLINANSSHSGMESLAQALRVPVIAINGIEL